MGGAPRIFDRPPGPHCLLNPPYVRTRPAAGVTRGEGLKVKTCSPACARFVSLFHRATPLAALLVRFEFDGQSRGWAGSAGTERRTGPAANILPQDQYAARGRARARPAEEDPVHRLRVTVCARAWGSRAAPHVHRGKHRRPCRPAAWACTCGCGMQRLLAEERADIFGRASCLQAPAPARGRFWMLVGQGWMDAKLLFAGHVWVGGGLGITMQSQW